MDMRLRFLAGPRNDSKSVRYVDTGMTGKGCVALTWVWGVDRVSWLLKRGQEREDKLDEIRFQRRHGAEPEAG